MGGVCSKKEATDAHLLGEALVNLVRADLGQLVLIRLRVTRKHLLKLLRLSFKHFIAGEARDFSVRDTPKSIFTNACSHVPVLRMNDEVGVSESKLVKVIVCLLRSYDIS